MYLLAIKYEFNEKLLNFIKNDSEDNLLPMYNILWIDILILILKYYILLSVSILHTYGIYVELIFGENIAFKISFSVEYTVSSIYLHVICLN